MHSFDFTVKRKEINIFFIFPSRIDTETKEFKWYFKVNKLYSICRTNDSVQSKLCNLRKRTSSSHCTAQQTCVFASEFCILHKIYKRAHFGWAKRNKIYINEKNWNLSPTERQCSSVLFWCPIMYLSFLSTKSCISSNPLLFLFFLCDVPCSLYITYLRRFSPHAIAIWNIFMCICVQKFELQLSFCNHYGYSQSCLLAGLFLSLSHFRMYKSMSCLYIRMVLVRFKRPVCLMCV